MVILSVRRGRFGDGRLVRVFNDRLEQIATPKLLVADPEASEVKGDAFDQALRLRRDGKAVKLCL